jgi:hypothetical protein
MSMQAKSRRPVGRQTATEPRRSKPPQTSTHSSAPPHERNELTGITARQPDPVIAQAKRDLDAGLVDTDMRATPGLDAKLRAKLVSGPGGKPPEPEAGA